MGSGVSFGLTDHIQDAMGTGDYVNRDSLLYAGGQLAGEGVQDGLTGGLGKLDNALDLAKGLDKLGDAYRGGGKLGSAAGSYCFPAGTPVRTADGGQKPIEELKPGDRVLSADQHTGERSYGKVVRTFKRTSDTLLVIRTTDGSRIEATPEHPFWVEGKGFVAAKRLARSDLLADHEGRTYAVVTVTERKGRFTVYNLEVEGTHTYYAGDAGWWVHNDCSDIAMGFHRQGGGGDIYRFGPPGWGKGEGKYPNWNFHDVYVENGKVFDPGRGYDGPMDLDDWKKTWGDDWNDDHFKRWGESETSNYWAWWQYRWDNPQYRDGTWDPGGW
jgi:hypothetical protein